MFWHFDPVVLVILVVGGAFSGWAALRVQTAFNTYSQVRSRKGYTAAQAADMMLQKAGIHNVEIVPVQGHLSDHYDPTNKRLALSENVYNSTSVAALGIACHEAGHAIQDATKYAGLKATSLLFKPAAFGSQAGMWLIVIGLILNFKGLALVGLITFGAFLAFQLVTLPVEFDATARAKREIINAGIIYPDEREGVDRVLNAAALTYVAAAFTTMLMFLHYGSMVLGGSRDE